MRTHRHVALTSLIATLAVLYVNPRASAETWRLTYDTVKVIDHSQTIGEPAHQEEKELRLTLWLDERRFALRNDDATVIFDFDDETMTAVAPDGKTYERMLLIGHLSFRVMELPNRIWIDSGLGESGLDKEDVTTIAELETLFGLPWDGQVEDLPRGQVDLEENGDTIRLRLNGEIASEAELSDEPKLDAASAVIYAKWLLYGCRLHPRMWDALAERGEVAQRLEYRFRDTFEDTRVTLRLDSAERLDRWPDLLPQTATEAVDEASRIAVWASRLRHEENLPPRPTRADVERAMDDAVQRGQPVDAQLASIEWALQSGERLSEKTKTIRDAAADDPGVIAYLRASRIGAEQPAEANALYESISRDGLEKGYVLDIFIANNLTSLGQVPQAYERFENVLDHNPYITGVWHDLANLSMRNFDPFTGWQMIETARLIQPDHPMLAPIGEYEERIRTQYPRFFLDDDTIDDGDTPQ